MRSQSALSRSARVGRSCSPPDRSAALMTQAGWVALVRMAWGRVASVRVAMVRVANSLLKPFFYCIGMVEVVYERLLRPIRTVLVGRGSSDRSPGAPGPGSPPRPTRLARRRWWLLVPGRIAWCRI